MPLKQSESQAARSNAPVRCFQAKQHKEAKLHRTATLVGLGATTSPKHPGRACSLSPSAAVLHSSKARTICHPLGSVAPFSSPTGPPRCGGNRDARLMSGGITSHKGQASWQGRGGGAGRKGKRSPGQRQAARQLPTLTHEGQRQEMAQPLLL